MKETKDRFRKRGLASFLGIGLMNKLYVLTDFLITIIFSTVILCTYVEQADKDRYVIEL